MATPDLQTDKWPEIGEEAKKKEKAKTAYLDKMKKTLKEKNLDGLQVRFMDGLRVRIEKWEFL